MEERVRFCDVCISEHSEDDPVHNSTTLHRFNFLLWQWNGYRRALVKNRHGIEVKIEPKQVNGFIYNYNVEPKKGKHCLKITPRNFIQHNNKVEFLCTIKNAQNKKSILLTSAELLHPYELYSLFDPDENIGNGNNKCPELKARAEYSVVVKFSSNDNVDIGSYKIPVSFTFQTCGEDPDTFTIARAIIVSIEEEVLEDVAPTKSPFTNKDWPKHVEMIKATQKKRYHDRCPIPPKRYVCLKYGLNEFGGMVDDVHHQLLQIRRELEPGHLTIKNYGMYWHNVLWLEEMAETLMLKRYNMENVTMKILGDLLQLEVPGLAEKRPSVVMGDMIEIRVHEDYRAYTGVIKSVNDKTVDIGYVHEELLSYIRQNPIIEMDVRFVLSRLPLERMHQGVDQIVSNGNLPSLFPDYNLTRENVPMTRTIRDTEFFNSQIVSNVEQKTAVLNILNASSKNAPYIVFGPPGTGKTVTIVEAILQIKTKTTHKILVCAPANAACDMLTEKLMMHCTNNELLRIMSETVDRQNINQHVIDYTNYEEDGMFMKVTPEELMQYRIVVTTLILVGRYSRKYHPDVVFIDEAAQACEPEVDCAIAMVEKGKQIVLAGDPKQLGPSISSKVSRKYGMGKSLLERLMDLELYQTLNPNPNFITMLKLNFRSHHTILTIPNRLFYDNQLQAVSIRSNSDPLATICIYDKIQSLYEKEQKKKKNKKMQHPGQAIEFCSILSKERRQGRSPSYFNTKEMEMVLKYVEALTKVEFDDEDDKVLPEQIGVVTPYIRQVYKIREHLRNKNFDGVEVGTTETFQGREKRVIIISTVRAQQDLLLYDKKYNLGFVSNEKRFNVALTRAMSKLIIIGCAHVLGTDSKWSAYMELSEDLCAFFGAPYAKRTQIVMDDIVRRFGQVQMLDTQNNH